MNPLPVPLPPADLAFPWWIDAAIYAPLILGLLAMIYMGRHGLTGAGLLKKQTAYLDHQRDVNERALGQSKSFEEMIARQYAETNGRTDQALAQSGEAIRLHAAALEQLTAINETLARLAQTMETGKAGPSA